MHGPSSVVPQLRLAVFTAMAQRCGVEVRGFFSPGALPRESRMHTREKKLKHPLPEALLACARRQKLFGQARCVTGTDL